MSWQRRARWGLALFAGVFALVVAFSLRQRTAPSVSLPSRQDPKAVVESGTGTTVSTEGAAERYRLSYQRMLRYADGTMKVFAVKVALPPRDGKTMALVADEALITSRGTPAGQAAKDQHIDVRGNVALTSSDGLTANAAEASYDSTDGVVRVPGELTFKRGRMTGRGVGATYDEPRDVLWLLKEAHVTVTPDAQGRGRSEMVAGSAGFARRERYVRLLGGGRVARENQAMQADTVVAHLQPQADIIQRVELRGHSSVTTPSAGPGALQSMTATDIDVNYAPDGQTLQRAVLAGSGVVQMAGAAGQSGRRLAGQYVDLTMAPDGSTLTGLNARDGVQVDLPAAQGTPARSIRAPLLAASGPPTGITQARFDGGVEFRELQAIKRAGQPAPSDRVVTSRTLDTATQAGFGNIDRATFTGNAVLREGTTREGASELAVYDVAKGTVALSSPGRAGTGARLNDEQATIEAPEIEFSLDGDRLNAKGKVSSVLKATKTAADARQRRPVMFRANEPVLVIADELASTGGVAVYKGHARLWQGVTAIVGDVLTLDRNTGNLEAIGTVRSTFNLASSEKSAPPTKAAPTSPTSGDPALTTIAAQQLVYTEAKRQAVYTGSPHMVGPDGDLTGSRLELYLNAEGDALERLEAHEQVTLRTVEAGTAAPRTGRGRQLTYFASDGKYVMRGAPVVVLEQLTAECRETTGSVLTFYRSVDSISVDGNEGSRTQTRSGGRCPERAN
jgi:lipopolysaccharide export system protein LptA